MRFAVGFSGRNGGKAEIEIGVVRLAVWPMAFVVARKPEFPFPGPFGGAVRGARTRRRGVAGLIRSAVANE